MINASYPGKGYRNTKKQFGTLVTPFGAIVKKDNLKIDYVTQYPHFIDELSILDNLTFASFKHKNREKIKYYLELFDCVHLTKKKPFELSGGEKQRINIINRLINDTRN